MATIALYAVKMNQMTGLISEVKNSVLNYEMGLFSLKTQALSIGNNICDMQDIISTVQSSTLIQEQAIQELNSFQQNNMDFIADVVKIDNEVAAAITRRKEEFYEKYAYLKPECEKGIWEKIKGGCKKAAEWCKEHWVAVVTAVVVVVIAAIAAVCSVAITFIAGIAGLIALVMGIADVICMLVTGGKGIAEVLRDNGFYVLADIFQGLSFAADLVSIVFSIGMAAKTMCRVGVKNFVQKTIVSAKSAFKEIIEKVFKKGFKQGAKNFFELTFKTFVFDIDDLKNWRAASMKVLGPSKNWIIGDGELIPNPTVIPKKCNPHGLTMEEIISQSKFERFFKGKPRTIPYVNGQVNWKDIAVFAVDIDMRNMDFGRLTEKIMNGNISQADFSALIRRRNFKMARAGLPEGTTVKSLEKYFGFKLTWHEDYSMRKCFLVPREIHDNLTHVGAVARFKFDFGEVPNVSKCLGEKMTQWGVRLVLNLGVMNAIYN